MQNYIPKIELEQLIRKRNQGRSLVLYNAKGEEVCGCWHLLSYGWKDADLDPEGCTGIDKITYIDEKIIRLEVGGHKTACDPTYECEYELTDDDKNMYSEAAHAIVSGCGFDGYWSGDDWSLTTKKEIEVPWVIRDNGFFNVEATAEKIDLAAEKSLEGYYEEMRLVSKLLDKLYDEIEKKYNE